MANRPKMNASILELLEAAQEVLNEVLWNEDGSPRQTIDSSQVRLLRNVAAGKLDVALDEIKSV